MLLLFAVVGCRASGTPAASEPAFTVGDFTTAAALPDPAAPDGWAIVKVSQRELAQDAGGGVTRAVLRMATTSSPEAAGRLKEAMTGSLVRVAGDGATADETDAGSIITVKECDCHPGPPTYQVVVTDGPSVIWLTVTGPAVDRRAALSLLRETRSA